LFSLYLFYGYALCNLAIQATETNKCDLFVSVVLRIVRLREGLTFMSVFGVYCCCRRMLQMPLAKPPQLPRLLPLVLPRIGSPAWLKVS